MYYQKTYCVYIITNKKNGTLYIGVTNNLQRRIMEHKSKYNSDSFSARYNLHKLIYFETGESIIGAIEREKQLKNWTRAWKVSLIESINPEWKDLYEEIFF